MTDTPCRVSIDELEYDFRNSGEDEEQRVECVIQWAIERLKKNDIIKAGKFTFTLSDAIDAIDTKELASFYANPNGEDVKPFNDLVETAVEELCRSWEDEIYAEYRKHVSIHENKYIVCL